MARHVRGNAKPVLQLLAILNGHIIIPVDLPSSGDAFEVFSVKSQGVTFSAAAKQLQAHDHHPPDPHPRGLSESSQRRRSDQ